MRNLRLTQTAYHNRPRIFMHKAFHECTHVFVRVDAIRRPLDQPYKGSYAVLERVSNFCFRIDIMGQPSDVSIDRLKPAYLETAADERTSGQSPVIGDRITKPRARTRIAQWKKAARASALGLIPGQNRRRTSESVSFPESGRSGGRGGRNTVATQRQTCGLTLLARTRRT